MTQILLFGCEKVAVCNAALYYYFCNPDSITRIKWSEKRLQEIEAHKVRAEWLREHGFNEAYRIEVEVYVRTIYEHTVVLTQLSREDAAYRPCLKQLRKKLRQELKQANDMGLYAFNREYFWTYLMAYPTLPLWYIGQWLRNRQQ